MPPWPVRFVAATIVYWLLAPFVLFGGVLTWHIIESIAFGILAASIPTILRRRNSRFANLS